MNLLAKLNINRSNVQEVMKNVADVLLFTMNYVLSFMDENSPEYLKLVTIVRDCTDILKSFSSE